MLDLFQIAAEDISGACGGLLPVVKVIRQGLFPIIQIGIPLLLIVLGTIDLGKAVISSDDKEVKAAQSRLVKRCIYAVAIFFVATLVTVLMNILVATTADDDVEVTNNWYNCWEAAAKKIN